MCLLTLGAGSAKIRAAATGDGLAIVAAPYATSTQGVKLPGYTSALWVLSTIFSMLFL